LIKSKTKNNYSKYQTDSCRVYRTTNVENNPLIDCKMSMRMSMTMHW